MLWFQNSAKLMTSPNSAWERAVSRVVREETVFIWVVSIWLFTIFYFDPRILALLSAKAGILGKLSVIAFVLCLNYLWFLTIYFVVVIFVSNWLRRREPADTPLPSLKEFPAVAVLYPTRNDFREDAAENLLRMDYLDYKMFVLDDSTLGEYQKRIDAWAARHEGRVAVIRRTLHQGYKAGNVNHGLRLIKNKYPYFAICDNDGFFPPNFIRDLLPYFEADPALAFVQTAQHGNPDQPEYFAQAMGVNVAIHFRHYVRARQSYGFVMFYGHGALMKTSVWEQAGGFPEIVTEDLSYSALIRTMGYHGRYTEK
ncbi:MAG: glycosyltransferase, partial [Acidobacteriota bacterium]